MLGCADLCALAPVDFTTAACVADFITALGYPTGFCDPDQTNTPAGCLACYEAIFVSDAHCVAAHDACF